MRRLIGEQEFMQDIVSRLKEERESRGLTIKDVAERCGVHRARLSEIEHGRANLTLSWLFRISRALGIELEIKFN